MTPASATSPPPSEPSALSRHATWIIAAIAFFVLAALVGLIVWAVGTSGRGTSAPRPGFDRFEPAWESAMRKASVEATFPAGPVDMTQVRVSGTQPFEATFTAEEISALMSVYRYETRISGQTVAAGDVEVDFPEEGVGAIATVLFAEGSRFRARATAPVTYESGLIRSPGLTGLRVEGFSVSGARRNQAGEALFTYLNRYLDAAPGLEVEEARIVRDGVFVRGSAPESLEHPGPLDP